MTDTHDTENEYVARTLSGLDWSGKDIVGREFDGCTFRECNFSEAAFSKCKFIDCQFIQCNLSLAKITLSKFSDVAFDECKMVGMDWTKAAWPGLALASPVKFHKCIVNDSSFFGLGLEELVMEECKAHDVDFRECNLTEASFTYTDFSHSLFRKTNLTRANFVEAINYDIDIHVNELKGAKFCRYEAARLLEGLGIELID